MVRRLHHAELLIGEKPADCQLQEAARGDVIAVENGDQIGACVFEGGVDVAGLGVLVVGTGDVSDAVVGGELAELVAAAVVEDVDVETVGRIVHVERGHDGGFDDVERLIVGGDEDVDGRPFGGVLRQRNRFPAERLEALEVAQGEDQRGVGLRAQQKSDEDKIDRDGR